MFVKHTIHSIQECATYTFPVNTVRLYMTYNKNKSVNYTCMSMLLPGQYVWIAYLYTPFR